MKEEVICLIKRGPREWIGMGETQLNGMIVFMDCLEEVIGVEMRMGEMGDGGEFVGERRSELCVGV